MSADPGNAAERERWAQDLAELAGRLNPTAVRRWAGVLVECAGPGQAERVLLDAHPVAGMGHHAARLARLWDLRPHLSGDALGLALLGAAAAAERADQRRSSVVASGPSGGSALYKSAARTTGAALEEVIRSARKRLLVVSYAHHPSTRMVEELTVVAERGVVVDVLLEEKTGALKAFEAPFSHMTDRVRLWRWPEERRGANGSASMHAKLVAADTSKALVGSANLTGHALHHNIEVGVLVRDPTQVKRLVSHFRSLMAPDGSLERV
ncbi:DISARM system phospholipase D-like protein DrmC [Nocardiopsis metallicus]|uniref:Phosphatidylserine/phosphatidylglycerophosphate/ cardiolipin synthase-like enzyme n=1 Tax=Nocardiopsis metallicus TaxID=179819 RepID=A0A840W2U1_9ACTN|nr:DISARM system phospholipase D-like protein DrmC [Nocardiopsis metallicus]MBB5489613.1 phosphatidylserine/phosphatidylglycerophosphate/cardiolipin synthase-like enzyme [Nocardiopsis metallicus]